VQAILEEINALRADAERRIARMPPGPAREQLVERVERLRLLRERILREGSNLSRESAQEILRQIRGADETSRGAHRPKSGADGR
jgi:hypothetical protein